MNPLDTDDPRALFDHFSNEYAEALQAYQALENQSAALMLLGRSDDLRQFVEQFLEMASNARTLAIQKGETNFAEWFGELIEKAEGLLASVQSG